MEVLIDDRALEELYSTGRAKKLGMPECVVDKFFATIQKIESALTLNDLRSDRGLRLEKLKTYRNRWSMRLSSKYRLEAEIDWLDEKQTMGKFTLKTISNHYAK